MHFMLQVWMLTCLWPVLCPDQQINITAVLQEHHFSTFIFSVKNGGLQKDAINDADYIFSSSAVAEDTLR